MTLVERSKSYVLIKRLKTKHHTAVKQAIIQMLLPFRKTRALKTITTDNGCEFAAHLEITRLLSMKNNDKVIVYFADAYPSWQKGAIENANGLIRQYILNKMSISDIIDKELRTILHRLNRRLREKLNFSTPISEFNRLFRIFALTS